jgi:DNA-binding NarL/FixJ family response regulator
MRTAGRATEQPLLRGRRAYAGRAWREAYDRLVAADGEAPLEPEDLERAAQAAYLIGMDREAVALWTRAFHEHQDREEAAPAARCGFWTALALLFAGKSAQGNGWLARSQRALDDRGLECAERGYLLSLDSLRSLDGGDAEDARTTSARVVDLGRRYHEPDLIAIGLLGQGQALIALGDAAGGVRLLDEGMVVATADDVSPIVAGLMYCAVILECRTVFDLGRSHEWTSALSAWCASQPDLVPFRGQCLVHRSEILQLQGAWTQAVEEAGRAIERLSEPPQPAVGLAHYQRGELHRLLGELGEAEAAYRRAGAYGLDPQPGLSLLRLAQGRVDSAVSAIRRAVDEAVPLGWHGSFGRPGLLGAYVQIMLAAGDVAAARAGADELSTTARRLGAPVLQAASAHAEGSVLLAEDDPRAALERLRNACDAWRELDAPYEVARVRASIGRALRDLGDGDGAEIELDAARSAFEGLGAAADLAGMSPPSADARPAAGLTARELEVLALVAAGLSNRQIANELVLSERTVARHVSNIFAKLGVSSRAAATAFAFRHGLV